jgi:transposase
MGSGQRKSPWADSSQFFHTTMGCRISFCRLSFVRYNELLYIHGKPDPVGYCPPGENKSGRHHLRQIDLSLMVARDSRLPLYYTVYPGNVHDSKHLEAIMDEMFGIVRGLKVTKERLTVVIDKSMNSDGNYAWIDEHSCIHFVTTYSTYFAQELAATPLDRFEMVDIEKNKHLIKQGCRQECLIAFPTNRQYRLDNKSNRKSKSGSLASRR